MQLTHVLCAASVLWFTGNDALLGGPWTSLTRLAESHRGNVSIAVKHLDTKESFAYRADIPMPTASMIKFPIMVEAYRQAAEQGLDLDQLVVLREEDKVPGSGILTPHFSAGTRLRVRDAVRLMIAYSDNTATNLVLDQIGIQSTAERMTILGLENTKLHAKVFRRDTSVFPKRSQQFGLGSSTAAEIVQLLEWLQKGELIGETASKEMLDHLLKCQDRSKLARDLPQTTQIAHKSGAVAKARCDGGIVYSPSGPIAICVMTSENVDTSWRRDNQANLLCARVGRWAYDYFNSNVEVAEPDRSTLEIGATGTLVEYLQRTLNKVLDPTPALSVDGDFGPITESAVVRFQESNNLRATGRVDQATWSALGPLVTSDEPARDPQIVNNEKLPLQPMDALTGSPFVTCRAWMISDAETGRVLWTRNSDQPLDIASTTKLITAYIVLRLAVENPDVLEEDIVFSRRADQTPGSTAAVRAGERLAVEDCLYGLLLPSGNDASVALAEHFGARLGVDEESQGGHTETGEGDGERIEDPLVQFVAEMNRTARTLGMRKSSFRNPHGLTAKGHVSTAADLTTLARAAWRLPRFRDYVGTRQYGCTVVGPGGYRRNVEWRNTNQLLKTEGYHGLKTGTTTKAGACLVSTGSRGDDRLFVVVLGSSSSDARYVDTRNLYRWAWMQLGHKPRD